MKLWASSMSIGLTCIAIFGLSFWIARVATKPDGTLPLSSARNTASEQTSHAFIDSSSSRETTRSETPLAESDLTTPEERPVSESKASDTSGIAFVTNAQAMRTGIGVSELAYGGAYLQRPDIVVPWEEQSEKQQRAQIRSATRNLDTLQALFPLPWEGHRFQVFGSLGDQHLNYVGSDFVPRASPEGSWSIYRELLGADPDCKERALETLREFERARSEYEHEIIDRALALPLSNESDDAEFDALAYAIIGGQLYILREDESPEVQAVLTDFLSRFSFESIERDLAALLEQPLPTTDE